MGGGDVDSTGIIHRKSRTTLCRRRKTRTREGRGQTSAGGGTNTHVYTVYKVPKAAAAAAAPHATRQRSGHSCFLAGGGQERWS